MATAPARLSLALLGHKPEPRESPVMEAKQPRYARVEVFSFWPIADIGRANRTPAHNSAIKHSTSRARGCVLNSEHVERRKREVHKRRWLCAKALRSATLVLFFLICAAVELWAQVDRGEPFRLRTLLIQIPALRAQQPDRSESDRQWQTSGLGVSTPRPASRPTRSSGPRSPRQPGFTSTESMG